MRDNAGSDNLTKRVFEKYSFALTNPRESPLAPLKKGGTRLLVPLFKGDLGGFKPVVRNKDNFSNTL
jgi:hypothetical protein